MAKYTIVKEAPESLAKDEYVITAPTFLPEVLANKRKAARGNITGVNHLRGIAESIAVKYDPENMNAYSIRPHLFEGRQYSTDEDLNKIVLEMLKQEYPAIFLKFVDYHVRHRPVGTKLIYFVDSGLKDAAQTFLNHGIEFQDKSETKKSKKKEADDASDAE